MVVQSFQRLVRVRLLQGTLHYCYMSEVSATAPDNSVLILALFKNNLVITHFF